MRIKIEGIPVLSQVAFTDFAVANTPIDGLLKTPFCKRYRVFFKLRRIHRPMLHGLYCTIFGPHLNDFAAGIPFLEDTLLGDFFYTTLLFGAYEPCAQMARA